MGHSWKPIEGLPEVWRDWRTTEFDAIRSLLTDLGESNPADLEEALRRSIRDAAIETGQVEDLYRMPRGRTETMIAEGIRPDLLPKGLGTSLSDADVLGLIEDQQAVLEHIFFALKGQRTLSLSFIRETHALLVRRQRTYVAQTQAGPQDQPLVGGEFKKYTNTVELPDGTVHEYCPPVHVASELEHMVQMFSELNPSEVPAEVRAAWLHHRFVHIHPFPDGNGRVARALANLVLAQAGVFPLVVRGDEVEVGRYRRCLVAADKGDLWPFVEFVRVLQRRQVLSLGFIQPKLPRAIHPSGDRIEVQLRRIEEKLISRLGSAPSAWNSAETTAGRMGHILDQRFEALAISIGDRFRRLEGFAVNRSGGSLAQSNFATLARDRIDRFSALRFSIPEPWELNCVIRDAHVRFNGIAVGEIYLHREGRQIFESADDRFVFLYTEPSDATCARFEKWLSDQLVEALEALESGL